MIIAIVVVNILIIIIVLYYGSMYVCGYVQFVVNLINNS